MKLVINTCYGGFGLSHEGIQRYAAGSGKNIQWQDLSNLTMEERFESGATARLPLESMSKPGPGGLFDVSYCLSSRHWNDRDIERDDAALVAVVEADARTASGSHAELKVVEIPDGVEWEIEEYDGREWVVEKHRTWR